MFRNKIMEDNYTLQQKKRKKRLTLKKTYNHFNLLYFYAITTDKLDISRKSICILLFGSDAEPPVGGCHQKREATPDTSVSRCNVAQCTLACSISSPYF